MSGALDTWRDRVMLGEVAIGSFIIEMPVQSVAESYAGVGFDFVILDMEHGNVDLQTLSFLIASCRGLGIASVVRVQGGERGAITKILDMGPDGIMFPAVSTVSQCAEIVELTRDPPLGRRGLAPIVRQVLADSRWPGRSTPLVICQIEAAGGVELAQELGRVEGIDVLFVGPYDLSQSFGVSGQLDHPLVMEAGRRVADAISTHMQLGVYLETEEQARRWREIGASLFAVGTDGQAMIRGCRQLRQAATGVLREPVGRSQEVP